MASCSGNGSRGHHKFTLNVSEINTSTTNNTSTINWSFVLSPIQTGWDWNISGISYSVNVDGNVASGTIQSYNGSSTVTIASGSKTITHNSDGSKSIGFSFSVNDGANRTYTPGNASGSGSMTLTKINRKATISSANNFNDEEDPKMNFSNPGGYAMNVWLEPNPGGEHLCIRNNIPNTGSYTWELTTEERNQLRQACTSNSCTVRYGIYTIIGGTTYSSYVDKTMTIVNANPIFEDFDYKDINSSVVSITGDNQVIVKGLSTLQVNIDIADKMETLKYATPSKYVATIDTLNGTVNYSDEEDVNIDLGIISNSGTKRLSVRAYDSRNNSTEIYKDIVVYDYSLPTIYATVARVNHFEDDTVLSISGDYSPITINNIEKNTISNIQYRYREIGGTWGSWTNMTFTASDGSYIVTDTTVSLDNTKEFEIEIKAIDEFNDVVITRNVDVGVPIFFISTTDENVYVGENKVLTEADVEEIKKDVYSISEEIKTHKVYVDENDYEWPIYRKTYRGTCVTNDVVELDTISNLSIIIGYTGTSQSQYNWTWCIPNNRPSGYENQFRMQTSTKRLELYFGNYYDNNYSFVFTVEYTKTTDAPASL